MFGGHEPFETLMKKSVHTQTYPKVANNFSGLQIASTPQTHCWLSINLKLGTGLPGCPVTELVVHISWTFGGNIYLYVGSPATGSHVVSSYLLISF